MFNRIFLLITITVSINLLHFECESNSTVNNTSATDETSSDNANPEGGGDGSGGGSTGNPPSVSDKDITVLSQTAASVHLLWIAGVDDSTPESDLSYEVYYSSTDNIDSLTEIDSNGTLYSEIAGNTDENLGDLQTSKSMPKLFFNIVVRDDDGNRVSYNSATTLDFELSSSASNNGFDDSDTLAENFAYQPTCSGNIGNNDFPKLSWQNPPPGTVAYVLIVDDPVGGNWVHLNLYNISTSVTGIPYISGGDLTSYGTLGQNDWGNFEWGGPCPPFGSGEHTYHFHLYALDTAYSASAMTRGDFESGPAEDHIITSVEITGTMMP